MDRVSEATSVWTPCFTRRCSICAFHVIHGADRLRRSLSASPLNYLKDNERGQRKSAWGYVRPRPGTAEDAMLKRSKKKEATGVVAQVLHALINRRESALDSLLIHSDNFPTAIAPE